MATKFASLSNANELKEFNEHLATISYVGGYEPSSVDSELFGKLKSAPKDHVHVARWWNHIASFSKDERAKWPSGGAMNGAQATAGGDEDDEDIDLFGSDDDKEDEEKERIKKERLEAYAAKKAKKPGVVAKSNVIFDVKPWDDTTDMAELEKLVRGIEKDGLVWGTSKLQPVAFGIKKLTIGCCVEDEKVSVDWLEEQITNFEDHVQSVDIAAFQKI